MAKDLLENLFDSIDLIVTNKLGDLNYDKTEQCTIQEVKGNNEYYVSNGAAKYIAYAQNDAKYKEGDSVYVTIPQGNYNNQKLIIGKHTAKKSNAEDWVSPMENFVNITGSINPTHEKAGLIANDNRGITEKNGKSILTDRQMVSFWTDTRTEPYSNYDRLCISADFSNSFDDLVIDGSYGIVLTGTIEDTRLENEVAELRKQIKSVETNNSYSDEVKKQKVVALEKKIDEVREKYKAVEGEKSFACVLDAKDMMGNPYDFGVPFRQEKLFAVEPTSKISNLALYFYQGNVNVPIWKPDLITNNNYLATEDENSYRKINFDYDEETQREIGFDTTSVADLFVENVTVNFGYSYETYSEDTAILYTLDPTFYEKTDSSIVDRELRLRWVHYDDEQKPHSIMDINDSSLKYHYTKIHWYRYKIDENKTEPDPLAGYFWEEIISNEDKFSYKAGLNAGWREEKFKVIIQYDEKLIKSEELVFSNPEGTANYGKMVTGLKINFPQDDEYKGTFYIYGDDHNASFSTEKTFTLIAEYDSIDTSNTEKIWDNADVICWKFPAEYTMIHKPEKDFEIFDGDVFLDAEGNVESVMVNGVEFTKDPLYHKVIRRVIVDEDGNSYNTRIQNYRVKGMFDSSSNNTIVCEVYKPEINMVRAEVSFTFGLHTTNGTKYTLAVNWVETANDGTKYQRPPAITAGDTKQWVFDVKILDSAQKEIEAPDGGWTFDLTWHEGRMYPKDKENDLGKIFTLDSRNKTLTVNIKDNNYNNYIVNAQYQVLQIQVNNFTEYALTTKLPIPVRSTRDIVGIEGPDRIYYDSAGYNPRYNDKAYKLIWKSSAIPIIPTWGIKDTEVNTFPSQKPQLDDVEGNAYLRAPDTFLPPSSGKYDGVCVFAKNGNKVLWVQPIYVTMDAYGSKFFNEWDGKMVINEDENYIMTSTIGAGKKDAENRYSGVVLGTLEKVKEKTEETGIIGFDKGVEAFSLLNNGTATLGRSGSGQIKFNGTYGYIMSGNFNGFNYNETGYTNGIPQWNEDGTEKFIDGFGVYDKAAGKVPDDKVPRGTYLGLTTGNAYFAGTIYAKSGNIGGWQLASSYLYSKANDKYTLIKSSGTMGICLAVPEESWENGTSTAGSNVQIYHSGKVRLGYAGIDGNLKDSNGNYYTGDNAYSVVINNGNAKFSGTIYSGAGEIGGWEITSTALKTKDVAITSNASGSVALSNEVFKRTIGGTERKNLMFAIGADFGVTNTGTVYAKNADITGNIYADYIEADDGTIGGWTIGTSTISGGKTILNSNGSVYIGYGNRVFSVGGDHVYPYASGLNIGASGGLACDGGANFYSNVNIKAVLTMYDDIKFDTGYLDLTKASGIKLSNGTPLTTELTIYRISSISITNETTSSPSNPGITYQKKYIHLQRQKRILYFQYGIFYNSSAWTNDTVLSKALE